MRFTWRHALFLLLCLSPFIYAAFFTYPAGDDFDRAYKSRYLFDLYEGFHEMFRAWWKWSGRYTYHFLCVFLGDVAEIPTAYAIACLSGLVLYLVGFWGLFASLSRGRGLFSSLVPALMAVFVVYGCFQSLDHTAYRFTDILTIWSGTLSVVWFFWALVRLWFAEKPGAAHVLFPCLTGIIGIGFYEHAALAVLLGSLCAWLLARYALHPHEAHFKKVLLVTGIAFVLMIFARGNFRRQTKRGADLALIHSQILGAWFDWKRAMNWFLTSMYPLAGLVLAVAVTPRRRDDVLRLPALLMLALGAGFILLYSAGLTLLHAASDVTINMTPKLPANLALVCGLIFCAVLLPLVGPLRRLMEHLPGRITSWALVIGLTVMVMHGAPNFIRTLTGLTSGEAAAGYASYAARMGVVAEASGKNAPLEVAPLSARPYPTGAAVLNPDPQSWPNREFARLYDLPSIAAAWPEDVVRRLTHWPSPPEYLQGVGQVFLASFTSGPNRTFDSDWLVLNPDHACGSLSLLLVPEPGPDRFLPQGLQRALLGMPDSLADQLPSGLKIPDLARSRTVQPGPQSRLMGYEHHFQRTPGQEAWAIPFRSRASGPLLALYVRVDDSAYRQVRLR